eukprot:GHVT01099044.1.p1 GENE.GHVT01099044.1~~GHVT01099044.1.p1  ORF type:complete len:256 (+),score=42.80 GHVT01099044.1:144-911(+)
MNSSKKCVGCRVPPARLNYLTEKTTAFSPIACRVSGRPATSFRAATVAPPASAKSPFEHDKNSRHRRRSRSKWGGGKISLGSGSSCPSKLSFDFPAAEAEDAKHLLSSLAQALLPPHFRPRETPAYPLAAETIDEKADDGPERPKIQDFEGLDQMDAPHKHISFFIQRLEHPLMPQEVGEQLATVLDLYSSKAEETNQLKNTLQTEQHTLVPEIFVVLNGPGPGVSSRVFSWTGDELNSMNSLLRDVDLRKLPAA